MLAKIESQIITARACDPKLPTISRSCDYTGIKKKYKTKYEGTMRLSLPRNLLGERLSIAELG